MIYNLDRISGDFTTAILVSSEPGLPDAKGTYYRYRFDIGGTAIFEPITEGEAIGYSSGQADGMGFQAVPDESFDSLEAVQNWLVQARAEFYESRAISDIDQLELLKSMVEKGMVPTQVIDKYKDNPSIPEDLRKLMHAQVSNAN